MKAIIAAALMMLTATAGSATDVYKYQVGASDGLKIWVVDYDSREANSLPQAVWQWEHQNPKQTLALCKREWLENAKQGNAGITTIRHSCRVFEK